MVNNAPYRERERECIIPFWQDSKVTVINGKVPPKYNTEQISVIIRDRKKWRRVTDWEPDKKMIHL